MCPAVCLSLAVPSARPGQRAAVVKDAWDPLPRTTGNMRIVGVLLNLRALTPWAPLYSARYPGAF